MRGFMKLSVQVPEEVREQYMELDYGYKRLACTSGLIMYFNADEETQRLYRVWAQAIAEGYATVDDPPEMVRTMLQPEGQKSIRGRRKDKR